MQREPLIPAAFPLGPQMPRLEVQAFAAGRVPSFTIKAQAPDRWG